MQSWAYFHNHTNPPTPQARRANQLLIIKSHLQKQVGFLFVTCISGQGILKYTGLFNGL